MLIAGFIAVCAILVSPAHRQAGPSFSAPRSKETAKTEKSSEQQGTVIQAPVDAIPGSAVKLDEPTSSLLSILTSEPSEQETQPLVRSEVVFRYLKVLFRTVIASNAP